MENEVRKPFAVFDIDGTIYRSNLLEELVYGLIHNAIFPSAVEDELLMHRRIWRLKRDRENYWNYINALVRTYIENIKGVPVAQANLVVDSIVKRADEFLYVWTKDFIESVRKTHHIVVISGAPTNIVGPFARRLGVSDFRGARYVATGGFYTGSVRGIIHNKAEVLRRVADDLKLSFKGSVAVGDTDFDIPMLELASRPIALNPNKELLKWATNKGCEIVLEHKDTIYHLGGKASLKAVGSFLQYSKC